MDWAAAVTGVLGGGALGSVVSWRALAFERRKWETDQRSHVRDRRIQLLTESIAALDAVTDFADSPNAFMQRIDALGEWRGEAMTIAFALEQQMRRLQSSVDPEVYTAFKDARGKYLEWVKADNLLADGSENSQRADSAHFEAKAATARGLLIKALDAT